MKAFYLSILMALALLPAHAQRRYNAMRETKKEFFKTEQARLIGDQILDYQRVTGGWPKNIDMAKPMTHEERQQVLNDKSRRDDSTTDNDATNMQMTYLARLYQATKSKKYRFLPGCGIPAQRTVRQWRMATVLARDAWLSGSYHLQR